MAYTIYILSNIREAKAWGAEANSSSRLPCPLAPVRIGQWSREREEARTLLSLSLSLFLLSFPVVTDASSPEGFLPPGSQLQMAALAPGLTMPCLSF